MSGIITYIQLVINNLWKSKSTYKSVCFILLVLIFNSCSNTRFLAEGEELYTGAEIKVISDDDIPNKSELINEMKSVVRPEPNTTLFGILRPKLSIYNLVGEPKKEKGARSWIRNKFGEAPVLFSDVPITTNIQILINRLENFGHFTPQVTYEIKRKNKKASVEYKATIQKPYTIRSISYPTGNQELELRIRQDNENRPQPGEPYNLTRLKTERTRIDSLLKNMGFFYFNPDYIIFRVDSTVGNREVDIFVEVKKDIPANARISFEIKNVIINTNYSLDEEQKTALDVDTTHINGMIIYDRNNDFRPVIFARTVFLRPGETYSRRNHEVTISHLMGLGTFQFVNVRFIDLNAQGDTGKLNAVINLTPIQKRAIRLELSAISKSNNFAGPGASLNYRNRNLLRGAELFIVNLSGNYETLISGRQRGLNSYELGINTELQVPRFIAPFNFNKDRPMNFIPRTRMLLGYQMLNRVQFFWLNSFNTSFGYIWNESKVKRHELNPISLSYVRLGNESDQFREILQRNPILRRSFENQLIFGSTYSFIYNDQILEEKKHNYHFRLNLDIAGNTMHLGQLVFREEAPTEEKPYLVLGIPYSQYARSDVDVRYYYRTAPKSRIVVRLVAGSGYAYGNARTLPYIKQFFIGGANSIRAFLPRSLGPGTYRTSVSDTIPFERGTLLYFDQTGDIKLESNLEFRFPIIGFLRGAVFLDAGNVWTFRENPNTPGGQFNFNKFYNEIAIGTGFGFRADVEFFVLRLDLGIPLREPFQPIDNRWVIHLIDFGSPQYRRQSLVLNIAIGYPF
ncbi:MAG: BamA/TamA family outer membrane protein [Bacteroidetes bacterium]|nr:BamA/TamA family outer membrane protein [Bacteroidota bacterium]HET6244430.1 BamA/TamA family outer membrane protein [Bacteroidia bacterium]